EAADFLEMADFPAGGASLEVVAHSVAAARREAGEAQDDRRPTMPSARREGRSSRQFNEGTGNDCFVRPKTHGISPLEHDGISCAGRLAFRQRQSASPIGDNFDQIAYSHEPEPS